MDYFAFDERPICHIFQHLADFVASGISSLGRKPSQSHSQPPPVLRAQLQWLQRNVLHRQKWLCATRSRSRSPVSRRLTERLAIADPNQSSIFASTLGNFADSFPPNFR
jgi:hypothetical protein